MAEQKQQEQQENKYETRLVSTIVQAIAEMPKMPGPRMYNFLRQCNDRGFHPTRIRLNKDKTPSPIDVQWIMHWEVGPPGAKDNMQICIIYYLKASSSNNEESMTIDGEGFVDLCNGKEIDDPKTVKHVCEELPTGLRRIQQMYARIRQEMGKQALGLKVAKGYRSHFRAGYRSGMFDLDGRVYVYGDTKQDTVRGVSLDEAMPFIAKALMNGPTFVTEGPIKVKVLCYVPKSKRSGACPRPDVIAHLEKLVETKDIEPGTLRHGFDTNPNREGTFTSEYERCMCGQCGRDCPSDDCKDMDIVPGSTSSFHLLNNREPTYFVLHQLGYHVLQHHWGSLTIQQREDLNDYLKLVGINPIAIDPIDEEPIAADPGVIADSRPVPAPVSIPVPVPNLSIDRSMNFEVKQPIQSEKVEDARRKLQKMTVEDNNDYLHSKYLDYDVKTIDQAIEIRQKLDRQLSDAAIKFIIQCKRDNRHPTQIQINDIAPPGAYDFGLIFFDDGIRSFAGFYVPRSGDMSDKRVWVTIEGHCDSLERAKALIAYSYLRKVAIPKVQKIREIRQKIWDRAGPLAPRFKMYDLYYFEAGPMTGTVNINGRVTSTSVVPAYNFKGEKLEDLVEIIVMALEEGFPFVTKDPILATRLICARASKRGSACPRPDVIAHFRKAFASGWYEPGELMKGGSMVNRMVEFKSCGSPMSRGDCLCGGPQCKQINAHEGPSVYMHLIHEGAATHYVIDNITIHMLQEHWNDIPHDQRVDLNKYLTLVGIEPIDLLAARDVVFDPVKP